VDRGGELAAGLGKGAGGLGGHAHVRDGEIRGTALPDHVLMRGLCLGPILQRDVPVADLADLRL
jgi:hypothetical protein